MFHRERAGPHRRRSPGDTAMEDVLDGFELFGGDSMEFVHEVTARLENKPGRLAKICSALAHEKINIRALAVMDSGDRSVLRLVTDHLESTKKVLTSLGTEFERREVLAVEVENRQGAL